MLQRDKTPGYREQPGIGASSSELQLCTHDHFISSQIFHVKKKNKAKATEFQVKNIHFLCTLSF